MSTRRIVPWSAALVWLGLWTSELPAALLTIEQAKEASQQTGRPIFAVAGSKT